MSGRRIWLCADDYGIAPGVNAAIRDLLARGRINATSVMVVTPAFSHDEAQALVAAAPAGAALGLHVTLTAPFAPLSTDYRPRGAGGFLSLAATAGRALARTLSPPALADEIARQLAAFVAAFGRAPDYVDGHQHIHVFPQIREALLRTVKTAAPQAWVRQCGRVAGGSMLDTKGAVLDRLSRRFSALALIHGVPTNPAFAGTYSFRAPVDYGRLFGKFLDGLPDGGLVMCHPGHVDATLIRLDPVTNVRESEYAFFVSDGFARLLAARGVTLYPARDP